MREGTATPRSSWRLRANAKINLGLWVGPRDARGYHPVRTLMQTIGLADTIDIEVADHYQLQAPKITGDPEGNLITKAYRMGQQYAPGQVPSVAVVCCKHIPTGAGLGGGSADAAAMLRWIHEVAPQTHLAGEAAQLGMDVPFLLEGGTAIAEGYGEQVRFLPALPTWGVLLAFPNVSISTARAYQAFDELPAANDGSDNDPEMWVRALRQDAPVPAFYNALERAAWAIEPAVHAFKERLQQLTGLIWTLSGSGSAYFTLHRDLELLQRAHRTLRKHGIPWTQVTQFAPAVPVKEWTS
ncbi:4-(cytidine 5'-diphospho)-2-C-methyl-D-erythritol kinase [Sulfobacillus sp. hq2]|uniref:4-(cytidine 5'-diphospho)-2-C-methyl-D-erythritol kinase n=1 Tax=Sulfobacillus TaxID=28033 RepID=UPI001304BA98|nr:4-(cytidine 5'-diphospho)-2-C-methyl-D-erythritol kinase [Sulfobacillus sp. hq2]